MKRKNFKTGDTGGKRKMTTLPSDECQEEDHEVTCEDEIVCPYCGERLTDSWEMEDEDEIECNCGKTFSYSRETTITYNSRRECTLNGDVHEYIERDLQNNGDKSYWCRKCPEMKLRCKIVPEDNIIKNEM